MAVSGKSETGVMFFQPAGRTVTAAQACTLDDEFLGSRPMQFFYSRIDALLTNASHQSPQPDDPMRQAVSQLVGGRDAGELQNQDDREAHLGMEAFALRHHAAEALLRLFHAVAVPTEEPICVWARITDGPMKGSALVQEVLSYLASDEARTSAWTHLLPQEVAAAAGQEAADRNLNTAVAWIYRAANLLVHESIDLNGAYNKIKHGLAARARDDHRMTILRTPPNPDGTVPVSAFQGDEAIDVFTRVTLQVLTRPANEGKTGLELTSLHLVPEKLLAESWMLATVLGAVFHTATRSHLQRHPAPEGNAPQTGSSLSRRPPELPNFPSLPFGPSPARLVGDDLVGMRGPVTHRRDGNESRGPALVTERSHITFTVDMAGAQSGQVVDG